MDTARKRGIDDPTPWLTSDEAAKLLHCSPERIRDMIHRKELRAFIVGKRWRIPTSDVTKRMVTHLTLPLPRLPTPPAP
jgi:excisionase family DNA binding protein